ncbi:MAG: phosphatidylglycerophosphatase A [Gammaproteobacteria bacterium]|nr:phosphatidylglycerophosphatase A [Gammaproteobacteria bacterium]
MTAPIPKRLLRDPGHLLSFGFGSGLSPYAPGTAGTLAAIPFYLLLSQLTPLVYLLATLLSVVLGVYLCGRTSKALGVHDHAGIVWDEFAGFFITMLFAPVSLLTVIVGFCLFRVFDILKPWPISVIDSRLHGGLGVMLDDVIAGVYAMLILQIYLRVFP